MVRDFQKRQGSFGSKIGVNFCPSRLVAVTSFSLQTRFQSVVAHAGGVSSMKLINQPTKETGCGVACLAMVHGYPSYESALTEMQKNGWVLPNGNVQLKQMQAALTYRNKALHYSEPNNEVTCLLFVVYGEKYRHWVVRHGGYYYDPLPRYKKPRTSISYRVTRAISIDKS